MIFTQIVSGKDAHVLALEIQKELKKADIDDDSEEVIWEVAQEWIDNRELILNSDHHLAYPLVLDVVIKNEYIEITWEVENSFC